ncbi:MAG: hypothetical protein HZB70_01395 [Candidatus Berkelbacteria bacterium]|nr:MAG: hypothetical protein HZB70_01395 [Candidatus Berkelbacteria bacterium]QQG52008.1 MAG: hypothetical protein HY845_01600 [Candidatus Berkelbacteria bacterium]
MVLTGFFVWWYGEGLTQSFQIILATAEKIIDFFSLEILFKTWVSPWKNDVLSAENISLSDQIHLWQMNLVSRFVGFVVRTMIIIVAIICLGVSGVLGGLALAFWIALPLAAVLFPILGVRMLFT